MWLTPSARAAPTPARNGLQADQRARAQPEAAGGLERGGRARAWHCWASTRATRMVLPDNSVRHPGWTRSTSALRYAAPVAGTR
jgi:hypothetical protein